MTSFLFIKKNVIRKTQMTVFHALLTRQIDKICDRQEGCSRVQYSHETSSQTEPTDNHPSRKDNVKHQEEKYLLPSSSGSFLQVP
jgi:hypothetical protein